MDTPVLNNSTVRDLVSSPKHARLRTVLLIIIVLAALSVIGWYVYVHFFKKPITLEEYRVMTIEQVKKDSPPVPDEVKAPVLKELAADNNPNAKKTNESPSTFSEAEREAILKSSFR